MSKLILGFCLVLLFGNCCFAQDNLPYVKKSFVIIKSTKKYTEAKSIAEKAAVQLGLTAEYRQLKPDKKSGLTFPDSVCENEGGFPCYIARGRYDDGNEVSIEWSNAFEKFSKGFYIVVVYSGNNTEALRELKKARRVFRDAYIKKATVYVGCMH
jgi:hypothetical protein